MDAKAGFFALAVAAALVMPSDNAMAQADDVAAQVPQATVENDVAAQDDAVIHPVPMQKPAVAERPAKSNLDQSAVRAAPVVSTPRPTRTSTRAIILPKILGSYR